MIRAAIIDLACLFGAAALGALAAILIPGVMP